MKTLKSLKGALCVAAFLLFSVSGQAQFLRTSYFMEGTHYRQQLNPALAPGRGYINFPVIGSLNSTVNSSSLGVEDVIDIIDNSSDNTDYFMDDDFINRLDDTNDLNVNLSTDILSAGWYKGKNFWSFNIGLRNDIGASISRDMFEFMRNMDDLSSSDYTRLLALNESIGKQSLEINSYAEVGIGFARNINDRLSVGGRLKALLGIGNVKLNVDGISVQTNATTGYASIRANAQLESSSKLLELQQSDNGYIDDLDFGDFGFAGYGGAIDLGISYKLTKSLTLSASILDLGFMKWSKNNTSVASANADQTYYLYNESDRYEFVDKVTSGEVLNYDMLELEIDETAAKSRSTSLTSTVVVGAEYKLLGNWLVVGALYTGRFAKPKTINELTFSANIRPKNYFNVAVSYSVLQAAGKTFGAAVKLGPLFVGTDYMFLGNNTKNVNAYFGLSIPLNKMKKKNKNEAE